MLNMENPFPGMNPWLESYWQSVHASFLTYLRDEISDSQPEGLAALTEERIVVENLREDMPRKSMVPDVAVSEPWDGPTRPALVAGEGTEPQLPNHPSCSGRSRRPLHSYRRRLGRPDHRRRGNQSYEQEPRPRRDSLSAKTTHLPGGRDQPCGDRPSACRGPCVPRSVPSLRRAV